MDSLYFRIQLQLRFIEIYRLELRDSLSTAIEDDDEELRERTSHFTCIR